MEKKNEKKEKKRKEKKPERRGDSTCFTTSAPAFLASCSVIIEDKR